MDWNEFATPDNRWKPDTPGAKISGTVTAIRVATMADGSRHPAITLRTEDGTTHDVLGSTTILKTKLAELKPNVGDTLTITYVSTETLAAGRTLKHHDVELVRGSNAQPSAESLA